MLERLECSPLWKPIDYPKILYGKDVATGSCNWFSIFIYISIDVGILSWQFRILNKFQWRKCLGPFVCSVSSWVFHSLNTPTQIIFRIVNSFQILLVQYIVKQKERKRTRVWCACSHHIILLMHSTVSVFWPTLFIAKASTSRYHKTKCKLQAILDYLTMIYRTHSHRLFSMLSNGNGRYYFGRVAKYENCLESLSNWAKAPTFTIHKFLTLNNNFKYAFCMWCHSFIITFKHSLFIPFW